MKTLLTWAKKNILKWTVGIAVLTFLFGPYVQERFPKFLRSFQATQNSIDIFVCTPLRNATLLVTSSSNQSQFVHSAGHFPFLQQARVIVVNNTDHPVPDSSVFVAPLNISSNFLMRASFYSDNNISTEVYTVNELTNNAYNIYLGNFVSEQVLVLEFVTLLPTSFVVEFGGESESRKRVVNAGSCDSEEQPSTVALPVDFYSKVDFPEPEENLFGIIEDISGRVGPLQFEVVLDYDCGHGAERQIMPMGGPVEYCNIQLNMPTGDESED